jgi:hypothetical protein
MNQEQLMDRLSRLKRKLSSSQEVWHSGRIDRLADALRSVERDLRARQMEAAAGHAAASLSLH